MICFSSGGGSGGGGDRPAGQGLAGRRRHTVLARAAGKKVRARVDAPSGLERGCVALEKQLGFRQSAVGLTRLGHDDLVDVCVHLGETL